MSTARENTPMGRRLPPVDCGPVEPPVQVANLYRACVDTCVEWFGAPSDLARPTLFYNYGPVRFGYSWANRSYNLFLSMDEDLTLATAYGIAGAAYQRTSRFRPGALSPSWPADMLESRAVLRLLIDERLVRCLGPLRHAVEDYVRAYADGCRRRATLVRFAPTRCWRPALAWLGFRQPAEYRIVTWLLGERAEAIVGWTGLRALGRVGSLRRWLRALPADQHAAIMGLCAMQNGG
ncbi:MAG: hypothetical protein IT208_08745 [Chthonomonadales bacterium]|nr:hypothetical protein [Chthonomonadales bacterium]